MQSDMPWSRGSCFLPARLQKAGAILALAVSCSAVWGFPATEKPDLRVSTQFRNVPFSPKQKCPLLSLIRVSSWAARG